MNYKEALMKFSKYYKDRCSVEFPTIFNLCNFRNKSVLEVGSGKEGYFVKEVLKLTDEIVASDASDDILNELRKNVIVKTKICKAEKLSFPNNSFDIVFSRWVAQEIENLEKAVKEMCRVAKGNVIIVLPSEEGDETKMLQIKFPDKFEYRKKRIINIKKWVSESGFKVKEERKILKFLFSDIDETIEIFSVLGFKNDLLDKEKLELKKFLLDRKKKDGIHLTQGASFICGYK